jgi:hypothetical protein
MPWCPNPFIVEGAPLSPSLSNVACEHLVLLINRASKAAISPLFYVALIEVPPTLVKPPIDRLTAATPNSSASLGSAGRRVGRTTPCRLARQLILVPERRRQKAKVAQQIILFGYYPRSRGSFTFNHGHPIRTNCVIEEDRTRGSY